jgi:hypothetical protein
MTTEPDRKLLDNPYEVEWRKLCERYLPFSSEDSVWRFSRPPSNRDPVQGWKLHISATILSANTILKRVAPVLNGSDVAFKAPRTLEELSKINSGLHYGFSQVGKFITVYPKDTQHAASLAQTLARLTEDCPSPAVPYDLPLSRKSCVYYRYGAFASEKMNQRGKVVEAIRTDEGVLVPDRREPGAAVPSWLTDPFIDAKKSKVTSKRRSPLRTTVWAYEALSQRGKGGVYRAMDLSVLPARLCILKEGRRHGETDFFGRDGHTRVKHEKLVLAELERGGVKVPRIFSSFTVEGHYYLVTEFIEGRSLQRVISSRRKKLSISEVLRIGAEVAEVVQKIHAAGWVWRDCKPMNLIVTEDGSLRPVDFEGACRTNRFDPVPWGTPGYIPPNHKYHPSSRVPDDFFALGATLYQLFMGRPPGGKFTQRCRDRLSGRAPQEIVHVVSRLLDSDPERRLKPRYVARTLRSLI